MDGAEPHIYCTGCHDAIASREDLLTVLALPHVVVPYHICCYSRQPKGRYPRLPLNSDAMVWLTMVWSTVCLVVFLTHPNDPVLLLLASIIPAMRAASWVVVERHLS